MPKTIHDRTTPARESSKAWAAWIAYRDMPAGQRSLERLCQQFKAQKALHLQNPTATPPPPTTLLDSLKQWSARWGWQSRLAVLEAQQEQARQEEMARQMAAQAREDAKLLHAVGSGALSVAAVLLSQLVDQRTGQLKQAMTARDLLPLGRVGIECIMASRGQAPEGTDPYQHIHKALREAPEDVRATVCQGLRAFSEFVAQHEGRRH